MQLINSLTKKLISFILNLTKKLISNIGKTVNEINELIKTKSIFNKDIR